MSQFFFIQRKFIFSQDVSSFALLLNLQTSKSETLLSTLLQFRSYTFDCFFRMMGIIKTKFDQILVAIMPSISNSFLYLS